MTTIVQLNVPFRQHSKAARQAALLKVFAQGRRTQEDVFWLKENAEMLNILESTGADLAPGALDVYGAFHDDIEQRMEFFPQYYRFLLSICLDLEDLGAPGNKGAALTEWVAQQGLPEAELSDLQRAEARRLCARRGIDPLPADDGLDARLRRFAARSQTFAMPNKKAAYELTHIVFYLSEYGRKDPRICAATTSSLMFAGTLAFLDFNADLLAEICLALRFAGQAVPRVWELWLTQQIRTFTLKDCDGLQDDYHEYLMLNWFMSRAGQGGFGDNVPRGRLTFARTRPASAPLRELSQCIYSMGAGRSADWEVMRTEVCGQLSGEAQAALVAAEASTDQFGAFFEGFARVGLRPIAEARS
ncbi:hypothetical protein [Roseovarius sp. M141]|uniref:DUF6902 family protein n=1 Tax=Roseovarius sp. M141 TaxID=2583806 RepID=UPI0020CD97C6|nr:hypothetical protein [Roseovarius sp. M141]MCQ0093239.1 hypothetical protein [Roseovarius sp. M141]